MTPIKIYVTKEEKETLVELAELSGLSLSSYIKSRLQKRNSTIYIQTATINTSRKKGLYIRLSDEEYNKVKTLAGSMTLASYARTALLTAGHPVTITIATDDLTDFAWHISDRLTHIQSMVEALAYRKVLMPQETEKILSTIREIRDEIKALTKQIKNNRNSIRNAGLRWLKQQYRSKKEVQR